MHTKKRDCTLVSSTYRGSRIARNIRTDNAKPTPNINILSCYIIVKVRVCVLNLYAKGIPNRHKRDNLYPVGHLPLLSPEHNLKVAKFQLARTERQ